MYILYSPGLQKQREQLGGSGILSPSPRSHFGGTHNPTHGYFHTYNITNMTYTDSTPSYGINNKTNKWKLAVQKYLQQAFFFFFLRKYYWGAEQHLITCNPFNWRSIIHMSLSLCNRWWVLSLIFFLQIHKTSMDRNMTLKMSRKRECLLRFYLW